MATVSYLGKSCSAGVGNTIFDHADELEIRVPTSCGRNGICHECVVEIDRGMNALSEPTQSEAFLSAPYRLACQAVVESDVEDVEFSLLQRSAKILRAPPPRETQLDPMVVRRGDDVRYGEEVVDRYRGGIFGVAVDVGTTTVVADLVNLENGHLEYEAAFENPQRFGGSDVMHRISYDFGAFNGELHDALINTLNGEIREMCRQLRIPRKLIYEIVVVGNSTMRDLVFGLDVQTIGQTPYKSKTELELRDGKRETTALVALARKLKIVCNRNARIYGVPLIASHVGADMTANLVAIDMDEQEEIVMVVDSGTNTEVVIGNRDRVMAASCPSGPAFEGGLVEFGMTAVEGAIENLEFVDGQFMFETIGHAPPIGICGSGLIDVLAELRRNGLMSPKGVFSNGQKTISIVPEAITFSRADASHLAQAKAANYCGQLMLLREYGIGPADVTKLYLAGGFANHIRTENAHDIGFLAPVPPERIVRVGNGASQGARELLLSGRRRESIDWFIRKIEHVELETMPDFFEMFVEGCQFKPMEIAEAA